MAGRLQFGGLLRDTEAQLSVEELCLTCAIISTADYCVETTEQVPYVYMLLFSRGTNFAILFLVYYLLSQLHSGISLTNFLGAEVFGHLLL